MNKNDREYKVLHYLRDDAMDDRAIKYVRRYIIKHLDEWDKHIDFEVYITWKEDCLGTKMWQLRSTLYSDWKNDYFLCYDVKKNKFSLEVYQ